MLQSSKLLSKLKLVTDNLLSIISCACSGLQPAYSQALISCQISQDCHYTYTHASTTQIVYLPHSASGLSCDRGGMDTSRSIHYSQCCMEEQGASNQTSLWQRGALAFNARGRTRRWVWEWNQEHCSSGMNYFSVHRLCGFMCLYDLGVQTGKQLQVCIQHCRFSEAWSCRVTCHCRVAWLAAYNQSFFFFFCSNAISSGSTCEVKDDLAACCMHTYQMYT